MIRVSVILNVWPVTCGTVTRVERTASSRPVHRTVCGRAAPLAVAAGGGVGAGASTGTFDPEQSARMALQRIATATRIQASLSVVDLRRLPALFGRYENPDFVLSQLGGEAPAFWDRASR